MRKDSSAHQHAPDRPQENSVPQFSQARRRGEELSNRFVMKPAVVLARKLTLGSSRRAHLVGANHIGNCLVRKSDGPRRRSNHDGEVE
jgi:hypothetical protein